MTDVGERRKIKISEGLAETVGPRASSKNPTFLQDKSSAGQSLAPALGAFSFETEESPWTVALHV
jgi:hypothetical protein